jgi:hypothetical protein
MGNGGPLPRGKADISIRTSAEVKKRGSIHPLLQTSSWLSAYLVKQRDNFTLPLFLTYPTHLSVFHLVTLIIVRINVHEIRHTGCKFDKDLLDWFSANPVLKENHR